MQRIILSTVAPSCLLAQFLVTEGTLPWSSDIQERTYQLPTSQWARFMTWSSVHTTYVIFDVSISPVLTTKIFTKCDTKALFYEVKMPLFFGKNLHGSNDGELQSVLLFLRTSSNVQYSTPKPLHFGSWLCSRLQMNDPAQGLELTPFIGSNRRGSFT